ncbi:unnamed protein product [Ilex paraguariensis]|uniref:Uncharacterized protein n=1 Tax=Ilex paraguariensis TaxID=185542 RepID=A0ABC8UPQ3_9AQUA
MEQQWLFQFLCGSQFLCWPCVCFMPKRFKQTWEGFSWESFHYVLITLKLALPSAAMVWSLKPMILSTY